MFPAFALAAAAIGAFLADDADAWPAYGVGLAAGFVPIAIEFEIARRKGRLFLRDRRDVARKRAFNTGLSRWLFGPAVAVAAVFGSLGGSLQAALCGLAAGYLLPLSVFLLAHFFRNHEEIRRLTSSATPRRTRARKSRRDRRSATTADAPPRR